MITTNGLCKAKLILEDGSIYHGYSFGAKNSCAGEVVFNTGMVGYYESISDPSYTGQILCLTYPLIGNYGIPKIERDEYGLVKHFESERPQIEALIVSYYSSYYSHYLAHQSLSEWLKEHKVPALCGIDTRSLTKKLRDKGTILGKIIFEHEELDFRDPNKEYLVSEVSCKKPVIYGNNPKKVAVLDCGVKLSIIKSLLLRGVSVIRFPYNYDLFNGKYKFDGLLISNGPGDPKVCKEVIESIRAAMEYNLPTFGICLGNQMLALAAGANTYKLKFGHRSQNQPCYLVGTKKCFITSQNHGFAVDEKTLPKNFKPWFRNLNDGSNEGILHEKKPFFSVQFHPEAKP